MIDHVWTVLCSNAVTDRDTNLVSLFNVIDQFNIGEQPPDPKNVIGFSFEIVSLWVRSDYDSPCKGKSRLTLLSPEGEVIRTMESELDLTEFERLRSRTIFGGVPGKKPGRYSFHVEVQDEPDAAWRKVAIVPVKVNVMEKDPEKEVSE